MEVDGDGLPLTSVPIPKSFLCPITHDVMEDPVATVDGQTYEHGAIEEWFRRGHRTSPATNVNLPSLALAEERALRRAIDEYLAMRPELARPEGERRSYQEAAGALQAEMLQKQAATAGRLSGLKAKLMESAATLLGLRGGSAQEVREAAEKVGMELHAMAMALEDGAPPSQRHYVGAERGTGTAAAAASSSSPQSRQPSGQGESIPTRCVATLRACSRCLSLPVVDLGAGRLASSSGDGGLQVWDVSAQRSDVMFGDSGEPLSALALLPEGKLVTGSTGGTVELWDGLARHGAARRRNLCRGGGHPREAVEALASLPNSGLAFTCGMKITLVNWQARRTEADFWDDCGDVLALASLPQGILASGAADCTHIKLWDWAAQRCEAKLGNHRGSIFALAHLEDGRLASGSADHTVKLWDRRARRCQATLDGHSKCVNAVVDLGSGKLASGSDDHTVKVWDLAAQRCQATLTGHSGEVPFLASLGDGRLASGSSDGSIKIWSP